MATAFGLHRYIGSIYPPKCSLAKVNRQFSAVQNIATLITGACVIGLTTALPLSSPSLHYSSVAGGIGIDGDRPHLWSSSLSSSLPSQQAAIPSPRGYEAPDDLGLPTRREPGGTR